MTAGMIGIFQEIVTLFVIVGVGYAAKRLRFMNDEFDRMLSKLVINIALPGMILGSVLTATELPTQAEVWLCLGLSVASNLVMFAVAYAFTLLLRIPDGHRGVSGSCSASATSDSSVSGALGHLRPRCPSCTPPCSTCPSTSSYSPWARGFSPRTLTAT